MRSVSRVHLDADPDRAHHERPWTKHAGPGGAKRLGSGSNRTRQTEADDAVTEVRLEPEAEGRAEEQWTDVPGTATQNAGASIDIRSFATVGWGFCVAVRATVLKLALRRLRRIQPDGAFSDHLSASATAGLCRSRRRRSAAALGELNCFPVRQLGVTKRPTTNRICDRRTFDSGRDRRRPSHRRFQNAQ